MSTNPKPAPTGSKIVFAWEEQASTAAEDAVYVHTCREDCTFETMDGPFAATITLATSTWVEIEVHSIMLFQPGTTIRFSDGPLAGVRASISWSAYPRCRIDLAEADCGGPAIQALMHRPDLEPPAE